MLSMHDPASRAEVLRQPLPSALRNIIDFRLAQADAHGLIELTHIIVIEARDTEAMIIDELGFSPSIDPVSLHRFGAPGFLPWWDTLRLVDGCFEIVMTVANAGFAYVILISDGMSTWPGLLAMCRQYLDDV